MRALLALLLLTGAFAAGCGGDDDDSSGSDGTSTPAATAPAETTEPDATETTVPTETTEEDTGGVTAPENLDEAIQQCKDGVEATPQISAELKEDLNQLCEDAADGDPEDMKKIAVETCERVIRDTVPAGEQQDAALEQCQSAGG